MAGKLAEKKVIVGLTGGIACYKIPNLVRLITKADGDVRVIMTESATRFITPLTMETVSQNPVAVAMFPDHEFIATRHIDLATWPDLFVIAPATANFLGKMANGISDDLLTTILCASPKPIMIAPAMNPQMWLNKTTQRNYETLLDLGYMNVAPAEGEMACDHWGVGRMAEPEVIFQAVERFLVEKKKS